MNPRGSCYSLVHGAIVFMNGWWARARQVLCERCFFCEREKVFTFLGSKAIIYCRASGAISGGVTMMKIIIVTMSEGMLEVIVVETGRWTMGPITRNMMLNLFGNDIVEVGISKTAKFHTESVTTLENIATNWK